MQRTALLHALCIQPSGMLLPTASSRQRQPSSPGTHIDGPDGAVRHALQLRPSQQRGSRGRSRHAVHGRGAGAPAHALLLRHLHILKRHCLLGGLLLLGLGRRGRSAGVEGPAGQRCLCRRGRRAGRLRLLGWANGVADGLQGGQRSTAQRSIQSAIGKRPGAR